MVDWLWPENRHGQILEHALTIQEMLQEDHVDSRACTPALWKQKTPPSPVLGISKVAEIHCTESVTAVLKDTEEIFLNTWFHWIWFMCFLRIMILYWRKTCIFSGLWFFTGRRRVMSFAFWSLPIYNTRDLDPVTLVSFSVPAFFSLPSRHSPLFFFSFLFLLTWFWWLELDLLQVLLGNIPTSARGLIAFIIVLTCWAITLAFDLYICLHCLLCM